MYLFTFAPNLVLKAVFVLAAEKQILTGEQTIFLKKALSIEIVVKKGEATEPRVLVCHPLLFISHSESILSASGCRLGVVQ